jgi:hypothetical protein
MATHRSSFVLCAVLAVVVIAAVTLVVSRSLASIDAGVARQEALYAQIVRFCGDSAGPELAEIYKTGGGSRVPEDQPESRVFCAPSSLDDRDVSAAQLKKLGFTLEVVDEMPLKLNDPETGELSDVAGQDAWLITAIRPDVTLVVNPATIGLEVYAFAFP